MFAALFIYRDEIHVFSLHNQTVDDMKRSNTKFKYLFFSVEGCYFNNKYKKYTANKINNISLNLI